MERIRTNLGKKGSLSASDEDLKRAVENYTK